MKIKATNGVKTRMMGVGELKQNPDWYPVTDAQEAKPAKGAKEVRTPGPKVVKTPEPTSTPAKTVSGPDANEPATTDAPPAPTSTEEIAIAAAGVNGATDQPTRTVPASPMGELITKIKACKTPEEVNALIAGEDRKTVLDVARKHIEKLAQKK